MKSSATVIFHNDSQLAAPRTPSSRVLPLLTVILGVFFLGGLFLISQRNFLLFHVAVELCTIGMAIAIFTIAWNTRHLVEDDAFLVLGLSYLSVGLLTLIHTLAYKGMGLLHNTGGANMATQFWIAARFLEGVAFITFPLSLQRRYPAMFHVLLWGVLPALLMLSIAQWRIFPDCFVEGTGLTAFKKTGEYLFCLLGLVALTLLQSRRSVLDRTVHLLISLGLVFSIGGELFYTLYVNVTSLSNVSGHYLHLLSIFLFYQALVHSSLTRPLETLFRSLSKQKQLHASVLHNAMDGFLLMDKQGQLLQVNEAYCRMTGYREQELLAKNFLADDALHGSTDLTARLRAVFVRGEDHFETDHLHKDGTLLTVEASINFLPSEDGIAIAFFKNITQRKQDEKALHSSQALLNATQRLAKMGGWEWHVANQTMSWTEETYRLHGFSPDDQPTLPAEFISRSLACYRREDQPVLLDAFRRCIDEGVPYDQQFPFRSTDGRELWIRTMAEAVFANDRITLVRGNIIDITREKRLEHLLAARLRLSEMSSILAMDDLLATVMDEAETLTGSTIGFFHFVDDDQQTLTLQAWSRSTSTHFCKAEGKGRHYPVAEAGVWVDCLHQRKAVIHNDYGSLPHRKGLPAGHAPVIRELVVPVFRKGEIFAIFGVGNKVQEYDQDDIQMVTALGDLVWDIILRKRAEEEVRHSEEQFRLSFERSPVGTAMISPDFRFLRTNNVFSRMIGYSEEELAHLTFADITHPEERQRDLSQVQRLLASEIDYYDVEKRYLHKNGAIIWARTNVTLVRDGDQKPLFFLPIVEDITARKKAEQALRESESRYQRIVDTAREGIWLMNEQRQTTYVNEHMATMLGLTPADMVGRPVEDFMFAEDLSGHYERMAARRQGQGGHYEHRFRHKDGHAIWTIVSATPLQNEEGGFAGSFAMFTNITERKDAEKRLLDRTDFIRRVLDSTAAHIAILDGEGVIIDVNSPWTRFGLDNDATGPEKIGVGTSYFCPWSSDYGDAANAEPAFEGIRQVQRGERESFQIEYPCHSPRENRWFTMRVLPLTGGPGQVLISHTDITPLKLTEDHLTAALAEKDVLLREVHHRVKNNLASIISLLDMQRRLLVDTQGQDLLVELGNRIRSMSLIHEKLYRADNLARIDFQDYLQSLVSHLRTSFDSSHIHCQTDAQGIKMPLDLAVPCGMIVNELVTNVMKHAFPLGQPAPGRDDCRLRVTMRQEAGVYTLCVADNGVGLPINFDWNSAKTLGMVLIRMLGRHQLGGSYVFDQREGLGLILTFNEKRGVK